MSWLVLAAGLRSMKISAPCLRQAGNFQDAALIKPSHPLDTQKDACNVLDIVGFKTPKQ
ncbi:MAG: hypothetical protein AB1530_06225 [Candidatus Omnitrophota bacterium]